MNDFNVSCKPGQDNKLIPVRFDNTTGEYLVALENSETPIGVSFGNEDTVKLSGVLKMNDKMDALIPGRFYYLNKEGNLIN